MSRTNNQEIVHQGWLTKSPPSKRVWRAKWRRRFFALRQSGNLPGQYYLDYYADGYGHKLKGTINLNLCEQVDSGLRMQNTTTEGSTVRGSVFSIRTNSRVYHLKAESVTEMEKWVDVICKACGMQPTDDNFYKRNTDLSVLAPPPSIERNAGPYIAISECITGRPDTYNQGGDRIFSFDKKNEPVDYSTRKYRFDRFLSTTRTGVDGSPRLHSPHDDMAKSSCESPGHLTDNEASITEEEFNLVSTPKQLIGTPVPPRPPKPTHLSQESFHKDSFAGPRIHEPCESAPNNATVTQNSSNQFGENCIYSNAASSHIDRNKQFSFIQNLKYEKSIPPAINRGLKPGRSQISSSMSLDYQTSASLKMNVKTLQYLDLDLDEPIRNASSSHLKNRPVVESPTVYKTVDFLKTQALNMTRIDTEAYRRGNFQVHVYK